jgi:predicted permease
MGFFTTPTAYRLNAFAGKDVGSAFATSSSFLGARNDHESHPALGHLILLVFEAVMEVVCVSLPGYIVARQGMFDADKQKFLANLNVALFTPCLIFTKLASQLTADKLLELAVIPVIFVVQTMVSYLVSVAVSKGFGFAKRPANFVTAMGVFGNSNSLPISLVISLSQTLRGLHWDKIPGDNDDDVAARGILYLLIFQQLGQLVRWSWGYHVLLAPAEKYDSESQTSDIEGGRYRDEPELIPGLDGTNYDPAENSTSSGSFESGGRTPVTSDPYAGSVDSDEEPRKIPGATPTNGNVLPTDISNGNMTSFPRIRSPAHTEEWEIPEGIRGVIPMIRLKTRRGINCVTSKVKKTSRRGFQALPTPVQTTFSKIYSGFSRFLAGAWEFMNPPLWAMLIAIIVASVPKLQHLFFAEGSFIANSVTRAITQSGGVAVPLILVVLGANLARNTLPQEAHDENSEENQIGTKLLVASLVSRMLLPTIVMAPLIALAAKYVPVSILDDPIFVIVCFWLTGAPSALQLAQICQINGVYEGVMSKLLFQSYVIWILPSTLVLVMCALEVVEWAA